MACSTVISEVPKRLDPPRGHLKRHVFPMVPSSKRIASVLHHQNVSAASAIGQVFVQMCSGELGTSSKQGTCWLTGSGLVKICPSRLAAAVRSNKPTAASLRVQVERSTRGRIFNGIL